MSHAFFSMTISFPDLSQQTVELRDAGIVRSLATGNPSFIRCNLTPRVNLLLLDPFDDQTNHQSATPGISKTRRAPQQQHASNPVIKKSHDRTPRGITLAQSTNQWLETSSKRATRKPRPDYSVPTASPFLSTDASGMDALGADTFQRQTELIGAPKLRKIRSATRNPQKN